MPKESDYKAAADALVQALLGKEPEPESVPKAPPQGSGTLVPSGTVQNLPAQLPTDTRMTWELGQDGIGVRFEVQILQSLVAFVIPKVILDDNGPINPSLIEQLALEVIAQGTINLAALQRRLSPEPCSNCNDLGWKSERISWGQNLTYKWVQCAYCNNRYNKPQPGMENLI